MRVRITHRRPGEVDGVDLSRFEAGLMYDVSPSLATYLIMTGTADPVVDERPALVVPVDEMPHAPAQVSGIRVQGSGRFQRIPKIAESLSSASITLKPEP